jgi:GDP-D-mannose dehydratase
MNIEPKQSVLLIGGSSQDAFFLSLRLLQNQIKVYATFRSSESANWRLNQITALGVDTSDFFPIIGLGINPIEIREFLKANSISIIYYLAAINLPSKAKVTSEVKGEMFKIHVENPGAVVDAISENQEAIGVFPLSSKMYALRNSHDRIVSLGEATNPQNYYGETKAIFWEKLKSVRRKNSMKIFAPILFNHESIYRFPNEVNSSFALNRVRDLIRSPLNLESLLSTNIDMNSREDWLHASDVAERLIQVSESDQVRDFIVASGVGKSIAELVVEYFESVEKLQVAERVREHFLDSGPFRPCLVGDISETNRILGALRAETVLSLEK